MTMVNSSSKEQFLIDPQGNTIAVVLDIQTYQKILEDLDEYYCQKAYDQAVIETNQEIAQGDYLSLDEYRIQRQTIE